MSRIAMNMPTHMARKPSHAAIVTGFSSARLAGADMKSPMKGYGGRRGPRLLRECARRAPQHSESKTQLRQEPLQTQAAGSRSRLPQPNNWDAAHIYKARCSQGARRAA